MAEKNVGHIMNQQHRRPAGLTNDELLRSITEAKTGYDLFKALRTVGEAFGFPSFLVSNIPASQSTFVDRAVLSNWDRELLCRCVESDLLSRAPYVQRLRSQVLCRFYRLADALEGLKDETDIEVVTNMVEFGHDGIVYCPVMDSNGMRGAITFSGPRKEIALHEQMALSFLAQHAYEAHCHIEPSTSSKERAFNPLSPREIECLRAAAKGLTSDETATQLGITPHTVTYHVNNAVKKLEGRNRIQAVVEAIQRGWLN